MRVDGTGRVPGLGAYQKNAKYESKDLTQKGLKKDEVQISSEAHSLLQSNGISKVDNQQRIDELKEQVKSGQYFVASEDIAEKLMQYWKHQR